MKQNELNIRVQGNKKRGSVFRAKVLHNTFFVGLCNLLELTKLKNVNLKITEKYFLKIFDDVKNKVT